MTHVEGWESAGEVLARMTQKSPARRRGRWVTFALVAVLLVQLIVAVMLQGLIPTWAGHDFTLYRDAASRWLATGEFYSAYQLAGPYPVVADEILYPPVALVLFVPFVYLPEVLWIAVPLAIIAWSVWSSKPSPLGWTVILFLVTFPQWRPVSYAVDIAVNGNPVLWVAAFVALASRYPVFGPFTLLKPTPAVVPFALVGIRHRSWWIGLAVFAGLCLAFLPMWGQYVTVLTNARGADLLYGLTGVPLLLLAGIGRWYDERARAIGARAAGPRSAMGPRLHDYLRGHGSARDGGNASDTARSHP